MKSDRNRSAIILKTSKRLLLLVCGTFFTLTLTGRATAQDEATSPANTPTTTNPSGSATGTSADAAAAAADAPDANAPAALPADQAPNTNPNDISRAQVPAMYQSPLNPQPTNIPPYAIQPGNPISPYTSTSINSQSPQITSPNLYLTGNNDLTQIATSNALSQAFSQGGAVGTGFYGDTGPDHEHAPIERIRLGPFDLRAAVVASAVADDNLRTNGNGGGKQSDVEFYFTPAVMLAYGLHDGQKGSATLVYAPTFSEFYHESAQDNIGQNIAFNAVYPLQRLTFNLSQSFTQTTGVNQDSNVRTTQEAISTTVGASYDIDEKLSFSSQIQNDISTFSDPGQTGSDNAGQGDTTTSLNNSLNYRLSEKLTMGPNFNIGYDRPESSAKSTFEQGTFSVNYAPTEKIGLFGQVGAEISQYDHAGGSQISPVFSIGVGYSPFDSTNLSLSANQSVHTDTAQFNNNNNNNNNQVSSGDRVVSTGIGAAVTQRIVQRVFAGFSFNYTHQDDSGGGSTTGSGNQDTITYRPSIQYSPTTWTSVSLYYQYLSNESDSNVPGQSYHDNQVGLSLSAQF